MTTLRSKHALGLGVSVLALVAPAVSLAQAARPMASVDAAQPVEEVIVTAEKRAAPIQDVPMSITAATGDQLTKQGISTPEQLTKLVPGFTYQQSTYGPPVYSIRGVGFFDNAMGTSPTVGIYVDQVPLPFSVMAAGAMLDLERVEVLKGPQGTLFGENATGGAINYIAAKPTDELHMGADVSYGRFNDFNGTAFVSGPISDTVKARMAIRHEGSNGWQQSSTRPGDTLGKKDFSEGRLLVDWQPIDAVKFELGATYWHDGGDTQAQQYKGFKPTAPSNPQNAFIYTALQAAPVAADNARSANWDPNRSFARHDDFYQFALNGQFELPHGVQLTSITSYSNLRMKDPIDTDGTAFDNFYSLQRGTLTALTQELRASGETGAARWMLGVNYQHEVANETIANELLYTADTVGPYFFSSVGQRSDQKASTYSAFASLDYSLTDTLAAQGSIRYTKSNRDFAGCISNVPAGTVGVDVGTAFGLLSTVLSGTPTPPIPIGQCITLDSKTFKPGLVTSSLDQDNLSWRVGLNWKPDTDTLIYGNITKGYKAGSYSMVVAILSDLLAPVTQESLLAYEVGFKRTVFDGRIDLTGAAFYYDYKDKQLLGVVPDPIFGNLPRLINIPKSHVEGAEFGVTGRPIAGLRISAGITYVKSAVDSNPALGLAVDPYGNPVSFKGESFPNAPRWQSVVDAEYEMPVSAEMNWFLGATLTNQSGSYALFGQNADFRIKGYSLLDVRAGVESESGNWRVQFWGHNITNEYYWVNVARFLDTLDRAAGMPATYGVTVSYRY